MGMQDIFKQAAQTIVNAFDDVPLTCTYTAYGAVTYDAETKIKSTASTAYTGVKAIFSSFSIGVRERDMSIQPTDQKAMIAVEDLTPEPSPNDTVTITTGATGTLRSGDVFNVLSYKTDPAEALYTIHLRAVT